MMGGLIALVVLGMTGFFVHGLLPGDKPTVSWRDLPAFFALGAVTLFAVFLLASWWGPVALAWFYLVTAGCAGGWFWLVRGRSKVFAPSQSFSLKFWEGGLAVFLAVVVLITCYLATGVPLLDWESRILWALKSQFLTVEPTLGSDFFRDPYRLHIHPRYPLLVPFLASWLARHQGGFSEAGYQLLLSLCAVLTLWQLLALLWRQVGPGLALGMTLVMAVTGVWLNAQYAAGVEIALCLFGVLALNSLCRWQASGARGDLVLAGIFCFGAAMTKNEGVLLGGALLGAFFLCELPLRGRRASLRLLALPAGVGGLLALGWLAQLAMIPAVSDEHYLQRLTPEVFWQGAQRLPEIGRALFAKVTALREWHLLWLTLFYLPVAAWTGGERQTPRRLAAWATLLYLAGLLLIYVISPWRDIGMHVDVTFDRVALPVLPLFIVVLACWLKGDAEEEVARGGRHV